LLSSFPVFTRSLPFFRRGYFVRNTNPAEKAGSVFASTATYFFSGCSFAQPSTSIGTPKRADFMDLLHFVTLFRLPLHAASPSLHFVKTSFRSRSSVAVRLPQHRHPVTKKTKKNGFFAPLGCLELHEINTNALRLFAHFFRRKPTGFCLKNELYFLASFQKNRAQNES
jgi:hypothetical protein